MSLSISTSSRADLHMHTTRSDGMHTPAQVAAMLKDSGMAVVAVTDHDTIRGALEVEEALDGEGPDLVIGTEVSSADGHVLALFVDRDIPAGLSAEATIDAIHDRGGLAVAAHPYSVSLGVGDLAATLDFDAIEMVNGAPLMGLPNARAAYRLGGARASAVGSSDAHVGWAIGSAYTAFKGSTAADLRAALLAGLTRSELDRPRRVAAMPAHTAWLAWLMSTPQSWRSARAARARAAQEPECSISPLSAASNAASSAHSRTIMSRS
jgi:predicted metal-dependent phosphoesterase TrpH